MRFEGARAVVTGGAAGIGRATADRLSAEGALVGIVDLNAAAAPRAIELDVSDLEAVKPSVDSLADDLGGIDLLINCAGGTRPSLS